MSDDTLAPPAYDHVWYWRKWLPERKGQPCRVLIRAGRMNTILVEFADGLRVTTSRYAVRRAARHLEGQEASGGNT